MYSNDIYMIQNKDKLPWNNHEQLKVLWSMFSKCKTTIRDGFRLENLLWRLWYRQSVLQKKQKPNTIKDIEYDRPHPRPLKRSRSLPDVSRKFFIDEPMVIKKKPILRIPKPVSLLSEMLRSDTSKKQTGLRRCQSRYCRLDQFFLNA